MKIILMGTPKYTKHTTVFLGLVIIQVNESTKKNLSNCPSGESVNILGKCYNLTSYTFTQ